MAIADSHACIAIRLDIMNLAWEGAEAGAGAARWLQGIHMD